MEKAGNCSCMFGSLRKAREGSRSECRNESAEIRMPKLYPIYSSGIIQFSYVHYLMPHKGFMCNNKSLIQSEDLGYSNPALVPNNAISCATQNSTIERKA